MIRVLQFFSWLDKYLFISSKEKKVEEKRDSFYLLSLQRNDFMPKFAVSALCTTVSFKTNSYILYWKVFSMSKKLEEKGAKNSEKKLN